MGKIFEREEIPEEAKTKSEELRQQADGIETETHQYDEDIRLGYLTLNEWKILRIPARDRDQKAMELHKAKQNRDSFYFSQTAKRNKILQQIEEINRPIADGIMDEAADAMKTLMKRIIFNRESMEKNPLTDSTQVPISHNLESVNQAREKLTMVRNIRGMLNRSLVEIESFVDSIAEEVNAINLKETKTYLVTPTELVDLEEAIGRKPSMKALQTVPADQKFLALDNSLSAKFHAMKEKVLSVVGGPPKSLKLEDKKK